MIPSGSLDRLITIQRRTIVRDEIGAAKEGFADQYSNVPAMIKPLSGREKFHVESARELSYKQYVFTIRHISGITEKHRIIFEGENYDIVRISEITRRQGLELLGQRVE